MDRQVSCANRWQRGINSLLTTENSVSQMGAVSHLDTYRGANGSFWGRQTGGLRWATSARQRGIPQENRPPSGETQVLCQKKLKGSKMAQLLLFF